MVTDQLSLLDLGDSPNPEQAAPRCGMCARPARWNGVQQKYAQYCSGRSCDNRERICRTCGNQFTMRVNGAGNIYCSTDCKIQGYGPVPRQPKANATCAWCGKRGIQGARLRAGTWPYICQECIDPIRHLVDRLKRHKVSHGRARQLLDDPGCEICGADLIARVRDSRTGQLRSVLVVDHDHDCCPGAHSCGQCVRGLLCDCCNTAAGMVRNDPRTAEALARYLANR